MKKRWKGFVPGFVTALLLVGMVGGAVAATTQKQANLNYSDIKITLDGKSITPLDANGKYTEPFTIDGVTYLPVRAVANALGMDVTWDALNSTVVLASGLAEKPTNAAYKDGLQATKIYKDLEDAVEYAEFIYKDISLSITYMYAGIPVSEILQNMRDDLNNLLPSYTEMLDEISQELQSLKQDCNTVGVLLDLNDNADKYLAQAYELDKNMDAMIRSAMNYAENQSKSNNDTYTTNSDLALSKMSTIKVDVSTGYLLTHHRLLGWINEGMK